MDSPATARAGMTAFWTPTPRNRSFPSRKAGGIHGRGCTLAWTGVKVDPRLRGDDWLLDSRLLQRVIPAKAGIHASANHPA
jgi:hypothetical protein